MCSKFLSCYTNRIVRVVGNTLLLLSISGCIASSVKPTLSESTDRQRPLVPIPQPTLVMPFLPEPANQIGRHVRADSSLSYKTRSPVKSYRPAIGQYSVVAHQVPATDVLFALARDTSLELDVIGEVNGDITLNAVNQTLENLLKKIARQVAIEYEITPDSLLVRAEVPNVKTYQVDYLNISRSYKSRVELATQVGSIRSASEGAQSTGSNGSQMSIENFSENQFWDTLVKNIAGIIHEAVDVDDAAKISASNIFVNRESGVIAVRAVSKTHRVIDRFLGEVISSSKRQVLIEATVVEVSLSDSFESGVDWKILDTSDGATLDFAQILSGTPTAANAATTGSELLTYRNPDSSRGDITATLKMLRQFGDVQVLSSPKIIALNNQPAVLKVVDNRVYFTFEVDRQQSDNGDSRTVVDSTVHSVPVGLVMNVTPFINSQDEVILNVRPTISRILQFAEDPSPALAGQTEIKNLIPEIQVREMESVLRVQSGEVAIIGGLMQNKVDNRNTGVPGIGQLPLLGKLFSRDTKKLEKTELLVFLRPTVMKHSDFQRNRDELRRFVPFGKDRLTAGEGLSGFNQ